MTQEAKRIGQSVKQDWKDFDAIAPVMARSVVAAEDANLIFLGAESGDAALWAMAQLSAAVQCERVRRGWYCGFHRLHNSSCHLRQSRAGLAGFLT